MFFEPGVPIRVEMNARRTEAMFPFPMSIAVLRAKTPQNNDINTGFRDAQTHCDEVRFISIS